MTDDVERLLEETSEQSEPKQSKSSTLLELLNIYKMPNLSQEQLNAFSKNYKYSAIDTSPLSKYVMHPLWNWGVNFFPMWVAPNLMTFAGYVCLVIDYCLLAYYDWNFTATNDPNNIGIPRWVWFVIAVLHAASHHLDGMDGKQARRTGACGTPLGELMDHGIDSNCMWMLPVSLMSVLGSDADNGGITMRYVPLLILSLTFNFWVSHWEKYNTGVLYLPWMFDISQVGVVAVFLFTGLLTPQGFKDFFADNLIPINTCFYLIIPVVFIGAMGLSVYNIREKMATGAHKYKTFPEMMRPWVSYLLLNFFLCSFPFFCREAYLSNVRVWTIAYGFSFSNVVCRLMMNQMSCTRCELIEPPIKPMAVMWLLAVILRVAPATVLLVYSVVAAVSFVHFAYVVINDMCDHYNICAFSITSKRR